MRLPFYNKTTWHMALNTTLLTVFLSFVPAFSQSAVEYRTFYSESLKRDMRYAIYLPSGYTSSKDAYPALYFLHGLFESERRWEERGARSIVDSLMTGGTVRPMIIAVPDGGNSFYVNSVLGDAAYENYLVKDFIPYIEKTYRVRAGRAYRAISGISMGGYGALMLAMRHPDLFVAASAHSAVLLPTPINQLPPRLLQSYQSQFFSAAFGNPIDEAYWIAHNPVDMAQTRKGLDKVAWYFDCGTEDRYGFFQGATKLNEIMDAAGIPHEYHLFPGGHGWEYARTTLHRSMIFHTRHFGTGR